jgi:hypothetical protein
MSPLRFSRRRCGGAFALSAAVACSVSLVTAVPAEAQVAVVTLQDGRQIEGEIVEQDERRIVLQIAGINTPFERDQVASVQTRQTPEEEYRQRKAALEPDDLQGRYDLAYWLFTRNEYDLARQEVEPLVEAQPESERLRTLAAAIDARQRMAEHTAAPRDPAAQPRQPRQAPQAAAADVPLLTERQINMIKVWELPEDLTAAQMRIRVSRDAIERAFTEFSHLPQVPQAEVERRRLMRAAPQEQLSFLFRLGSADAQARVLYDGVEVVGDPPAITDFRRHVYGNYVQRYFRRMFGGGQVEGFYLASSPNTTAELYTNFFILSTTMIDGRPMIDRLSPRDSLLLQWGLPRELAIVPAPPVPGWRPMFAGVNDPNFERIESWVRSLYSAANVDYGIEYAGPIRQDSPFDALGQPIAPQNGLMGDGAEPPVDAEVQQPPMTE